MRKVRDEVAEGLTEPATTIKGKSAENWAFNKGYPHGKRTEPAWHYSLIDFQAGWDECLRSEPRVLALVIALERAKDVIDFCYMNQPKNKHQVEIEAALATFKEGKND